MVKKLQKQKELKKAKHKEFVDILFNIKAIRHNMKKFRVNCIELKLMMVVRFHCLALMIKDMYYMMTSIAWHIFIRT